MGTPTERPSEREDQNHVIIKDFPGVFVRPPFQFPPSTPSQEDQSHPFCRPRKFRRGVTRTQSGEAIHTFDARSALEANACDVHTNAGDSSIGYPENAGDAVRLYQANGEDTGSKGQTDMVIAPVEVATNTVDSSRSKLSSDTPEDISLDQLANSGNLQKNIQENSAQDAPTFDTVAETDGFSAGESQEGATWSLFID